jgi:hypothetical protein
LGDREQYQAGYLIQQYRDAWAYSQVAFAPMVGAKSVAELFRMERGRNAIHHRIWKMAKKLSHPEFDRMLRELGKC